MKHNNLRKDGDTQMESQRWQAAQAGRTPQALSPSARLLRLSSRYAQARREGRTNAATAIKRMANRIVESIPA